MRSILTKFKFVTILIEETSNFVQFIIVHSAECSHYLKFDCCIVVKSNKQLNTDRILMAKSMMFILFKIEKLKNIEFRIENLEKNDLSYTKVIISIRIASIIMLAETIIPFSTSRRMIRLQLWWNFIWTGTWHIRV